MKKAILEITWLSGIMSHGWGNGYVIIPKGHPLHGMHYDTINVDVHGGLTFSQTVDEELIERFGLEQSDLGSWAVGFDCAHGGDNQYNCSQQFVEEETERLRQQLLNYKDA